MADDMDAQGPIVVEDGDQNEPAAMDVAIVPANGDDAKDAKPEDLLKGEYTWTLTEFTLQPDKVTSDPFEIGGYQWVLLCFPRGNHPRADPPSLSLYLAAARPEDEPWGWGRAASFKLSMLNADPAASLSKETQHAFSAAQVDWGFTNFAPVEAAATPGRGFNAGGAVRFKVELTITSPDGALYDSRTATGFVGLKNQGATCYMNSLLQTLYNVNAFRRAVYRMPTSEDDAPAASMPLALQSVFYKLQFTPGPVSTKDLTASFGWDTADAFQQHDVQELNRVLCDRLEEKMKGTRVEGVVPRLFEGHTQAFIECVDVDFRSQRRESFQDLQLDVKGCATIYDSFDRYCEVETLEGDNAYEAEGHGKQAARKGVLFDDLPPVLQLHLKRFEYDWARDTLVKVNDRHEFPEELDLDAGNPNAAEADSTTRRSYFTPGARAAAAARPNRFRLLAVLVHAGGVHGGHYFAYVRPKSGEGWLKFDDERVEKATAAAAVADNWGGDGTAPAPPPPPPGGAPPPPPRLGAARFSSAYMLVYVRASEWDSVMCGVAEGDIPEHVRARLTAEAAARERQRRERAEAHLYALVRVATDADLKAQIGSARFFDLVDFSAVELQLKVRRSATFADVQRLVEERAGVPAAAQRFWRWAARQNATLRPSAPLLGPADDPAALAVERLIAGDAAAGRPRAGEMARLDLYLEAPPPAGAPPPPPPAAAPILLFLKYYDFAPPGGAPPALAYAGALAAPAAAKVSDLAPHMCRAAGLPESTTLEVFEEVKSEPTVMVEPLARGAALAAAALEDGDVLVFQRRPSAAEERGATFPRAHEFLAHVRNRVSVLFKPLDGPAAAAPAAPAPANGAGAEMAGAEGAAGKGAVAAAPPAARALDESGEVRLELLKDMAYEAVSGALAAALGLGDPLRVRLTAQSPYSAMPRHAPLAYRPAATLEELVRGGAPLAGAAPPPPLAAPAVLFYEAIDLPLPEFERLVAHRITFHDAKHGEVAGVTVRVAKDLTVAQLLEEARAALPAAARRRVGAVAPLRLMEVYQWRVWQLFDPAVRLEDGLAATANLWHLRAEAVPEDQRGLAEPGALHAHVLQVCDREGAPGGREGFPCADPFVVALREGETAAELRARLREELGVPAREFAAWRLVLLSGFNFTMEPLPDDAVVVDRFTSRADLGPEKLYGHAERQFLGLHHENKNPRRTAAHIHRPPAVGGAGERALRIRA